jgi:hypothetical protein
MDFAKCYMMDGREVKRTGEGRDRGQDSYREPHDAKVHRNAWAVYEELGRHGRYMTGHQDDDRRITSSKGRICSGKVTSELARAF